MTAAELLARAEQRAKVLDVTKLLLKGAAIGLAAFAVYCGGVRRGRTAASVAAIEAHRATVMDTIHVVERRVVVDTQRVRVTSATASIARASSDSAVRAVTALADSAPSAPIALALPALHVCQQAITADTIAYRAQATALADMTEDRDAQQARAEDDERELKVVRPSRIGFKSGVAVGVAIVAAVVHFLR